MAWSRLLLPSGASPKDDEMNEVKAAIEERDTAARLAAFGRLALDPSVEPVNAGDIIGKITVRREAVDDLLEVDNGILSRAWRSEADEDFGELCMAYPPDTNQVNIFTHAGLINPHWTKTLDDPISRAHLDDFYYVINKMVRLITGGVAAVGGGYIANVASDAVWNTARANSLAGQNGGGGGNLWVPWFGRFGGDLAPPSGYSVDTITAKEATFTFDTSSLASRSISGAWAFVEKRPLYGAGVAGMVVEDFDFDVKVGATVLRSLTSDTAADITGFRMYGSAFDVWMIPITPTTLVNKTGDTVLKLAFTSNPLADVAAWTVGTTYSQAFSYSPTGEKAIASLIIELDDWAFCAPPVGS